VGGLFGGSIAGPVSDRIGRSAALVLMNIPHLIGWLVQAYAQFMQTAGGFISVLMIGRWFTGFGTGWGSLVISVRLLCNSLSHAHGFLEGVKI
jgi:MFS family permease